MHLKFVFAVIAVIAAGFMVAGCEPAEQPPPDPVTEDTVHLAPEVDPLDPATAEVRFDPEVSELMSNRELGLFAYTTTLGEEVYVAVLNQSPEAHSMRFPKPAEGQFEVAFLTDPDEPHRVQTDATGIIVEISGESGMLLRRTDG